MRTIKIGVISETLVQQHYLKHAIEESGYKASLCLLVSELIAADGDELLANRIHDIDAWVVDVDTERLDEQSQGQNFQEWLYAIDKPVICGEGNTYNAAESHFISWSRQLKRKLLALEGQMHLTRDDKHKAEHVWVLAASTGGPEAVKRFLDNMEKDLSLGFIYVQHIDQMQHQVLSETIIRDSRYDSCVATHGSVVCDDTVVVIPADQVVEFQENGTMVVHNNLRWRGVYTPSIDQVVANVANVYGDCSGVIFFTGMGEDGVVGCRLMSLRGGTVWSQSLNSCTATSMPQAVIDTGYVSKMDTPENLAIHLKATLKKQAIKTPVQASR